MYKDFKQSESLDTGFVGGSGIIWMFSGIILGLLVGLGMYYFTNNNSSALSMVGTVQNKIKQAQSGSLKPLSTNKERVSYKQNKAPVVPAKKKVRQTKFSYYAVLPTLDVPTGVVKPIDTSREVTASTANTQKAEQELIVDAKPLDVTPVKVAKQERNIEKEGDFLLQVASYKKKSRANLTRGRLTKKGIDAYIQEKKIKGRTWYRVVAGPVNQNSINNWKNSAEKMGHRPMVISLR
jgi:cell division protein FtsN